MLVIEKNSLGSSSIKISGIEVCDRFPTKGTWLLAKEITFKSKTRPPSSFFCIVREMLLGLSLSLDDDDDERIPDLAGTTLTSITSRDLNQNCKRGEEKKGVGRVRVFDSIFFSLWLIYFTKGYRWKPFLDFSARKNASQPQGNEKPIISFLLGISRCREKPI